MPWIREKYQLGEIGWAYAHRAYVPYGVKTNAIARPAIQSIPSKLSRDMDP
jgi:hypothetical protein